jgi:glutaredoxin
MKPTEDTPILRLSPWLLRILIGAVVVLSVTSPTRAFAQPPDIEIYSRPGCPYCERADDFLAELQERRPGVDIARYDVTADPQALERLRRLAAEQGVEQLGVPAFWVGGELVVGFTGAETTGARIESLLGTESLLDKTEQPRGPPADSASTPPDRGRVEVPLFGAVDVDDMGLLTFTVVLGLIDGFNPCAMWVLLFLLSLLVNLDSRRKMAAIAGTFVLVSGLVYFAFMVAWLNFFALVGVSRTVQWILGAVAITVGAVHVKDFFAFKKGLSLSIPESAKPGIARRARRILTAKNMAGAMASVVVLAVLVNMVELLCTAGLPAVYTAVLAAHDLPGWQHYGYLALYNVAYMLDDGVMVAVGVITLSRAKLQERGGRLLKLVSGAMLVGLGLLLIAFPEALHWG